MSLGKSRYLGLAAIAVAVVGLVGLGAYGIAVSCGEKAATEASYASAEKASDGKSCAVSKSAKALFASTQKADAKKARTASACASKKAKASAALASAGDESGCAAKRAAAKAALAAADDAACDPADCDDAEKAAKYTLASAESGGEYVCASKKAKSAALASAEGSSCSAHKSAASAKLASDDASCSSSKSAKTAQYASADDVSCAATASLCETYAACSVNQDLMTAEGAKLERFEVEKKQDGVMLADVKLPEFEAWTLDGNKISSKALHGTPTALVMLASHCGHSYQSIAVLEEASKEFGAQGLRVVGLMVGADQKVAKSWFEKSEFQVWTADASVADALESHLVPTYVLIDANGNVRQKLVGYKKNAEVASSLKNLLALDVNAEWVRSKKKS